LEEFKFDRVVKIEVFTDVYSVARQAAALIAAEARVAVAARGRFCYGG
jgi:hypothetical protein